MTALPAPAGTPVVVEIVLLRTEKETGCDPLLAYRHRTAALCPPDTPHAAARRLAEVPDSATEVIVHSTSWRYQPDGRLVLTYLIYPDPEPAAEATPLTTPRIAHGADPSHPDPPVVLPDHVATHAARHLAWLAHTDPVIAHAVGADPDLWQALRALVPAPAGALHLPDLAAVPV
ncbi:MAG TPA: hypothetical protein VLJ59_07245 [Mycobacteriales bacterium]|nr:hypothetical protein [Mycobacteriales bacterium]